MGSRFLPGLGTWLRGLGQALDGAGLGIQGRSGLKEHRECFLSRYYISYRIWPSMYNTK